MFLLQAGIMPAHRNPFQMAFQWRVTPSPAPRNRFIGAGHPHPYKSIFRGGLGVTHPENVFTSGG